MINKKIELLAPAGNLEKLKWAIYYGADAVYLGGTNYSLRANAKNFTLDEIKEGVKYAHEHNAKVYVTVNIVFHNEDINGLKEYLEELSNINVDGVIFSDPLVLDIINENNIKLDMHFSTQASIMNKDACKYYISKGVSRIVLARECSREDIKEIIEETGIEIECFAHGAMCSNVSGRCVLSNYFTNRDANRGGCCQVCRFNFNLYNEDYKKISETDNFSLASKDLSLAKYINDMIDIGVASFKLEGRMRSVYYIATIVNTYRKLIDMYYNGIENEEYTKRLLRILYRCANRDVTAQFYDKVPTEEEQYFGTRQEDSNQDFLGIVLDYDENNKIAIIEQRNYFSIGDKVSIFGPKTDTSFIIDYLVNEENEAVDAARHPREIVKINCPYKVEKNDLMRVNFLD